MPVPALYAETIFTRIESLPPVEERDFNALQNRTTAHESFVHHRHCTKQKIDCIATEHQASERAFPTANSGTGCSTAAESDCLKMASFVHETDAEPPSTSMATTFRTTYMDQQGTDDLTHS